MQLQSDEGLLLRKCLQGEQHAMKLLYEQHKTSMFGLCLRYAKDSAEAQDFLQEGFIKVFQDLAQYGGSGALGGWIRRVIVNTILQKMRKRTLTFATTDLATLSDSIAENDTLFQSMRERVILSKVQSLPDGFRVVFNMYVMEGYSHKEIAEQLGISENTSKSQLSRAKEALRKMLEKEYS